MTHNTIKQGLVTYTIALAREKGASPFVADGLNRWAAVHVLNTARLYRLALEKQEAGTRYHAVAKEGVPVRDIAEAIGRGLKVPVTSKSSEPDSLPISTGHPISQLTRQRRHIRAGPCPFFPLFHSRENKSRTYRFMRKVPG